MIKKKKKPSKSYTIDKSVNKKDEVTEKITDNKDLKIDEKKYFYSTNQK